MQQPGRERLYAFVHVFLSHFLNGGGAGGVYLHMSLKNNHENGCGHTFVFKSYIASLVLVAVRVSIMIVVRVLVSVVALVIVVILGIVVILIMVAVLVLEIVVGMFLVWVPVREVHRCCLDCGNHVEMACVQTMWKS
jgi:hypothetical protein